MANQFKDASCPWSEVAPKTQETDKFSKIRRNTLNQECCASSKSTTAIYSLLFPAALAFAHLALTAMDSELSPSSAPHRNIPCQLASIPDKYHHVCWLLKASRVRPGMPPAVRCRWKAESSCTPASSSGVTNGSHG